MGNGGIGIVRLSGSQALSFVRPLFKTPNGTFRQQFDSHRLYYGFFHDPESKQIVDEVLLVWMAGPKTYTREDIVEIHTHGGPAVQRKVLELVIRQGAELAAPGEFTKRAFLNGRIDLTQAEGVIDLIQSRSRKAATAAASQVAGRLKERIQAIREATLHLLSRIEAAIDFPEDVRELLPESELLGILRTDLIAPCRELIQRYDDAHIVRDGIRVIIIGHPNVGKSSLLNRLLQRERAIVSPLPGTTRDFLEESADIHGVPLVLIDTAGIRDTDDPLEKMGIERAYEKIRHADIVLWLTDASNKNDTIIDRHVLEAIGNTPVIQVVNKIDLVRDIDPKFEAVPSERESSVVISALKGWGIERLRHTIVQTMTTNIDTLQVDIIPNIRHRASLMNALECAIQVEHGINNQLPVELLSMDLKAVMNALDELLGRSFNVDLLEQIFKQFCIGK